MAASLILPNQEAHQKLYNLSFFYKWTHQTSFDVVDGLPGVHARPVVQHVADTGRAVDEADVVFAPLGQRVKTANKMCRRKKKP